MIVFGFAGFNWDHRASETLQLQSTTPPFAAQVVPSCSRTPRKMTGFALMRIVVLLKTLNSHYAVPVQHQRSPLARGTAPAYRRAIHYAPSASSRTHATLWSLSEPIFAPRARLTFTST